MSLFLSNPCHTLAAPLRWLPQPFHGAALALLLNRVLARQIGSGELDFMRDRVFCLDIADLGIRYRLCLVEYGFAAAPGERPDELVFSGELDTFLQLATGREDADTLFFQRRLRIRGDTATGLHLKNFVDALGEPPLPPALRRALERFAQLHGRWCTAAPAPQSTRLSPGRPLQ